MYLECLYILSALILIEFRYVAVAHFTLVNETNSSNNQNNSSSILQDLRIPITGTKWFVYL